MSLFIAVTPYKDLDVDDLEHYIEIAEEIDLLLLRVPMTHDDLCWALDYLLANGFSQTKLMIHSDMTILEKYDLNFIHFREDDVQAFEFKKLHPHISVSMSTHSVESVKRAREWSLDFVFFGHVFESRSKYGLKPRSYKEIKDAVSIDIPVYAIGGIDTHSIKSLPHGFEGVCAISFFRDRSSREIQLLREEWLAYV
ncbi:thiamine phosphate synthase [Mammaliicoccus sciuri]|uniref:Thiamine phosphate synthase n=1 Tax=Mammaliicoccus sciuri TaxID=1296 RepID=A0AAI8DL87_MAMSC|nr:thiamine phosphate synthase [Mammaliicoccus sciuri]PCQ19851.1 thiamine phosphate synthase [Klebsiella pneumoniae]ASE35588.1 thiamine phosphate synthase [Mammaliicoccus sciuri]MBO3078866.1 thiamine phosphate synthase [Mammaliicoccus sciuri]MBV5105735.1 thiamine phosphate synthase [Mammaliicoccus sciuri]MCD8777637.1 thiamine phosphate synthase [Mammaliicoccus sciuri]